MFNFRDGDNPGPDRFDPHSGTFESDNMSGRCPRCYEPQSGYSVCSRCWDESSSQGNALRKPKKGATQAK